VALSQPDHAVLRKAQRRDSQAFALIVRQYETPVFNYVLRMVRNHHLAEDITQEVFLRVFQGLPRFSFQSKFTTWLFQVTKNRVLDELRALDRRPSPVELGEALPLRAPEVPFERRETIGALWRAIGGLGLDLKMALLLRDLVGLSYQEIADSLEITLAAVKWRIYTAREEIQLALAADGLTSESDELVGESATAM
jgi:RNA polymerase sigma-70 factor, ECF subfamily